MRASVTRARVRLPAGWVDGKFEIRNTALMAGMGWKNPKSEIRNPKFKLP
jgi:hypothetical protein